jgi:patatin-like phospholipase/acyl hydrolase
MNDAPFRILSLDGGGIRGFFSASLLAQVEESLGKSVSDHVDLIVGTSTGAIIALGLASGLSATEVLSFYREYGPKIFSGASRLKWLFRPKYGNSQLIVALREIFGDKTLNDLQVPVCIASYELVEGWPRVFKDDHHPDLHWGGSKLLWKVAAASSAAPTFLPAFQMDEVDCHVDGGIWANNPIVLGIAEAVRFFGQPLENISALSVGTGSKSFRLTHSEAASIGIIGWGRNARLLELVLEAQSKGAHNTACMLLKEEQYLRIDADLSTPIPLDDHKAALSLIERGAQAGRMNKAKIMRRFFAWPRAINPRHSTI